MLNKDRSTLLAERLAEHNRGLKSILGPALAEMAERRLTWDRLGTSVARSKYFVIKQEMG